MIVPRLQASSIEKRVSPGNPAVGYSFLVSLAFALAYDYVETVVAEIESLTGALDTIADDCDGFVLEDFTCFFEGEFFAGDDGFFNTAEI